jgi:hypothetical protein
MVRCAALVLLLAALAAAAQTPVPYTVETPVGLFIRGSNAAEREAA